MFIARHTGFYALSTRYGERVEKPNYQPHAPTRSPTIPQRGSKRSLPPEYSLFKYWFYYIQQPLGNLCRNAINSGRADFTPISISEIPLLYRSRHLEMDYALIMVTPPDKHGFCSLGASVGTVRSAIQNAKKIIGKSFDIPAHILLGQVNPMAPISYGDGTIHCSKIDFFVHGPQKLEEIPPPEATPTEQKIAKVIADNLVEDGATIQMGFGRIPYEVTNQLRDHRDLGVHAEMFSDGIVNLVNLGVVNNRNKTVRRGRIVASYTIGTEKVFNFINENPLVALYDIAWVNSLEVIARNPKVTSVNTAFEIDLTGQCAGDSLGNCIYSGVGGQIDYIRGASLSIDGRGRPIITMCSKNSAGESSIVPFLTDGSGVVATRAHVHYVVTEYGIAYLFGKNIRQRAHALINIAHPDFRESLEKAAFDRLKTMPSP
ncbi:unnamed protein product [Schistocephalus solidus]|uniref:Acetyl-CoA hydrolase n=1 Tax=Schistocephalus solidus TaxID=70667 RepID=A0A183TP61_SCHSO|nr:unnamed protein product [Schistocephalus solidus]